MQAAMTPLQDAWRPLSGKSPKGAGGWAPHAAVTKTSDPSLKIKAPNGQIGPIPFVDYDGELADVGYYCKEYGVMCENSPAKDLTQRSRGPKRAPPRETFVSARNPASDHGQTGLNPRENPRDGRSREHKEVVESFAGLTEEELADVFVPVSRPQISASFVDDPLVPPMLPTAGVPGAEVAFSGLRVPVAMDPPTTSAFGPLLDSQGAAAAVASAPPVAEAHVPANGANGADDHPGSVERNVLPTTWWDRLVASATRVVGSPEALNLVLFALVGLLLMFVLDQMVRIGVELARARALRPAPLASLAPMAPSYAAV